MWEQLLWDPDLIFYLIALEGIVLCILQIRTNFLLRKGKKEERLRKERRKRLREEVKEGNSGIPVMKFERQKETKDEEKKSGYDEKEMAVLQEMLAEFFG